MRCKMRTHFISLVLIFRILVCSCYHEFYCPSRTEWRIRAKWYCNNSSTASYTCLYNVFTQKYEEACKYKHDILDAGEQFIISYLPRGEKCKSGNTYQPFPLELNKSSECVLRKSMCTEEGQVLFHNGSSKEDRSCRCDFEKGYAFVFRPKHPCKCTPALEDCSCYAKQCFVHFKLTPDYLCIHTDNRTFISPCPGMVYKRSKTGNTTAELILLRNKDLIGTGSFIDFSDNRIQFSGILVYTILGSIIVGCIVLTILFKRKSSLFYHVYDEISPPYNVHVSRDMKKLKLTWSKPRKWSAIKEYRIYHASNSSWEIQPFTVQGADNLCFDVTSTHIQFKPCTTYRFEISAYSSDYGESLRSEEAKVDTEKPAKLQELNRKGENGTIVLVWTNPGDNVFTIDNYKLEIEVGPHFESHLLSPNTYEYRITNALHETYLFRIYSCCQEILSDPLQCKFFGEHAYLVDISYDGIDRRVDERMFAQENIAKLHENFEKCFTNGFEHTNGTHKIEHIAIRTGSLLLEIVFTSRDFKDEITLKNTIKNAFDIHKFEEWELIMKTFSFRAINPPAPPQSVNVLNVDNVVTVIWKQPMVTFFNTTHYIVQIMTRIGSCTTREEYNVEADEQSFCLFEVLPSRRFIEITICTGVCHSIRSSESSKVRLTVEGTTSLRGNETIYKRSSDLLLKNLLTPSYDLVTHSMNNSVRNEPISNAMTSRDELIRAQVSVSKVSEHEEDSIWFYDILNITGLNEEYRWTCKKAGILNEIMYTFGYKQTCYYVGSEIEGTSLLDDQDDLRLMYCDEAFVVIDDIVQADPNRIALLLVKEFNSAAGYVKLQLVVRGIPCKSTHIPYISMSDVDKTEFKTDQFERIVKYDKPYSETDNKPELKYEKHYNIDSISSYRCKTWPKMAQEWLFRKRYHGWPSAAMIQKLKSYEVFLVRKGHPDSLEWQIVFTLQERQLMFTLTDVQHKCYSALIILNRDIINLNYITSYHWKTCLFYVMEKYKTQVWNKKLLLYCIQLCLEQMLEWVENWFCPNYFIFNENLFDECLPNRHRLKNKLEKLLDHGIIKSLQLEMNRLYEYVISKEIYFTSFTQLRDKNDKKCKQVLYTLNLTIINSALDVFNHSILGNCFDEANGNITRFIGLLWLRIDYIRNINTITEHTVQDTKHSLSLLVYFINACLAANISAMAFQHPNHSVRNFLLFRSLDILLTHNDLAGRLKFISVLYACGLYKDCEWYIDQEDKKNIMNIPSICNCKLYKSDANISVENIGNTSQINDVATCVSFLPTELPITPDVLKYEMFRYFGILLQKTERTNKYFRWNYRAVIDSNIYFFLLKYLVKKRIGSVNESVDAVSCIFQLLCKQNVRHLDVTFNVLAWIFRTEGNTLYALNCLNFSYKAVTSLDLGNMLFTNETTREFNSAKLHALVIIYNTWFERKQSLPHFCFHCSSVSSINLQRCRTCRISTYCSKQCQRQNWKIHKVACRIARRYHCVSYSNYR